MSGCTTIQYCTLRGIETIIGLGCSVQKECNKYSAPCTLQSYVTMRFSRSTKKAPVTSVQYFAAAGWYSNTGGGLFFKDKEVHAHRAKPLFYPNYSTYMVYSNGVIVSHQIQDEMAKLQTTSFKLLFKTLCLHCKPQKFGRKLRSIDSRLAPSFHNFVSRAPINRPFSSAANFCCSWARK